MKAIGITCGIGSMLIGARQAGFDVVGNIEWRKYYYVKDDKERNTFTKNFKSAFLVKSMNELSTIPKNIDLAMGHPECGNFSNLRVNKTAKLTDACDIPLFVDLIKKIKPRFFIQDNLPKAFIAYSMKEWHESFPEYDLFPEWISNYHYGNSQFFRRRLFIIGALKKEKFVFRSGEFEHLKYLKHAIKGLSKTRDIKKINHIHWKNTDEIVGWKPYHFNLKQEFLTIKDFKNAIKTYPVKKNISYINKKGELKLKPGYSKIILENYSPTMSGGGSVIDNHYRADTLNALTMRERARIQGCPDDFIFYPLNYIENVENYRAIYKQIGKFMPVEFCRYISEQIVAHIKKKKFECSKTRLIKSNPYIDEAKKWYCENVGYRHQKKVCQACWLECKGLL